MAIVQIDRTGADIIAEMLLVAASLSRIRTPSSLP